MDRVNRLRTRTGTVAGLSSGSGCHSPSWQHTARARRKLDRLRRIGNVIECHTQATYTCQLSLLILLYARSCNTLHPVCHDDARRTIGYNLAGIPRDRIPIGFYFLLDRLARAKTLSTQLRPIQALEDSLVDALHLLHSHNISFPVSAEDVNLLDARYVDERGVRSLRLFLPYNKKASWALESLPPTWKADQLSAARSLFSTPKLLIRLSASSKPTLLDLASQEALTVCLKMRKTLDYEKHCLTIAPLTAELAHQIAHSLLVHYKAEAGLQVLESFFGGPMVLPEPGTSPDTIYTSFSKMRARSIDAQGHNEDHVGLDRELEAKLYIDSPALVVRFVICRADAATQLAEHDSMRQWWLTAMDLHDAFLSHESPASEMEARCATDSYHYREPNQKEATI